MIDVITEALAKKFSSWVGKEIIVCQDVKSLAVMVASGDNDKVTYPLFALLQARNPRVNYAGKTQMSAEGLAVGGEDGKIQYLRLVPLTLSYAFVMLSQSKSKCLDIWQQVVTKVINNPGLEVEIPYSEMLNEAGIKVKRTHWFGFNMVDDEIGLDVSEQLLEGNLYGQEIGLEFRDAYIMFNREDVPVGIESIEIGMRGDDREQVEQVWKVEA